MSSPDDATKRCQATAFCHMAGMKSRQSAHNEYIEMDYQLVGVNAKTGSFLARGCGYVGGDLNGTLRLVETVVTDVPTVAVVGRPGPLRF